MASSWMKSLKARQMANLKAEPIAYPAEDYMKCALGQHGWLRINSYTLKCSDCGSIIVDRCRPM